jgi:hypothetical protein
MDEILSIIISINFSFIFLVENTIEKKLNLMLAYILAYKICSRKSIHFPDFNQPKLIDVLFFPAYVGHNFMV